MPPLSPDACALLVWLTTIGRVPLTDLSSRTSFARSGIALLSSAAVLVSRGLARWDSDPLDGTRYLDRA